MTLQLTVPTIELVSTGAVSYNIPLELEAGNAINTVEVYVLGILQTAGVDYTIDEGTPEREIIRDITINFINVPANGAALIFRRKTDRLQDADFGTNPSYASQTHEEQADKNAMAVQEVEFALENPSTLSTPTNYPVGANGFAQWNDDATVLETATAPMTYQDARLMQPGDVVIKDFQVWVVIGKLVGLDRVAFTTNFNNFQSEVDRGEWRTVVGQQGQAGPQGMQGPQGGVGGVGPVGPTGNEEHTATINNDALNDVTGIEMGEFGEQTVRMDVEIIRTDNSEERQVYFNLIAMLFAGAWQIKILTSTGFGGNPIGVTFTIQAGTNELLYTSDNMTGTGYIGTLRMFLWRFD